MEPFVGFLGLLVPMFPAALTSSNRNVVNLRVVVGGLILQFAMAYLVLRTRPGQAFFNAAGRAFNELLGCVDFASCRRSSLVLNGALTMAVLENRASAPSRDEQAVIDVRMAGIEFNARTTRQPAERFPR